MYDITDDAKITAFKNASPFVSSDLLAEHMRGENLDPSALNDTNVTNADVDTNVANRGLAATDPPLLAPGMTPNDYRFQIDPTVSHGMDVYAVDAMQREFADAFYAAQVPTSLAPALAERMQAWTAKTASMDAATLHLAIAEQDARLSRMMSLTAQAKADADYAWSKFPQAFRDKYAETGRSAEAFISMSAAGNFMRARDAHRAGRK